MFELIRGGCFSRHAADFIMNRPQGLPYYLFLVIKSNSEINIDGVLQICKPNSILLIKPNTPYSYRNPDGEYIDDWLHFSCLPQDISLLDENMFHNSISISNPRLFTTYIQQLLWENNFARATSRNYYVDSLFRILLQHICDEFRSESADEYSPYRYKLQRLRLEIQAAPYKKYSAQNIASDLSISTSYLQYLYKHFFHISLQADIINMRVDYAKELITSTTLPLEQIAYACGYSNEIHFYRQFLRKTGMTPGEYRKHYV
ncbi:MAG: helix-turn-helix domain-containing protein [Lachnospiraceae bacterium]|nr:helix-turn-helix domain-containing protein [Lachnospiraceae bacterium]